MTMTKRSKKVFNPTVANVLADFLKQDEPLTHYGCDYPRFQEYVIELNRFYHLTLAQNQKLADRINKILATKPRNYLEKVSVFSLFPLYPRTKEALICWSVRTNVTDDGEKRPHGQPIVWEFTVPQMKINTKTGD